MSLFFLLLLLLYVQIGDYLLTLPQQLEPFTSQDSPALAAALRDGRLPFPDTDSGLISQGTCTIPRIVGASNLHTHTHTHNTHSHYLPPPPPPPPPTHIHMSHTVTESSERGEDDQEDHPSDAWLGAIARGTMETYVQSILQIPSLPPQAALQLATDIGKL